MNDPKHDPDYRKLTVMLESLPRNGRTFAITTAENGFAVWYYDPKNRILSPGLKVFATAAETLAVVGASLVAERDDDERIDRVFYEARRHAELARLEFLTQVYSKGGYGPRSDHEKAAGFRARARALREEIESGKHPDTVELRRLAEPAFLGADNAETRELEKAVPPSQFTQDPDRQVTFSLKVDYFREGWRACASYFRRKLLGEEGE